MPRIVCSLRLCGCVAILIPAVLASGLAQNAPTSPLTPLAAVPSERRHGDLATEMALSAADADEAWSTEVLSATASAYLRRFQDWLEDSETWPEVAAWIDPAFQTSPLRPDFKAPVFEDGSLRAYRTGAGKPLALLPQKGPEALRAAIEKLVASLTRTRHSHFKVISIDAEDETFETMLYVELHGASETAQREVAAYWIAGWRAAGPEALALQSLRLVAFDEVVLEEPPEQTWFRDETLRVLAANPSYHEQLVPGFNHWRAHLDFRLGFEVTGPHGLAVGDVDGDGRDDLYLCEPGGLPNRLFLQQADGSAIDHSSASGLDFLEPTHAALWVDLDNDGDQDLVATVGRYVYFYANDGKARFEQKAVARSASEGRSLCAIDYNNDRFLDIYVCGYFTQSEDHVGLGRPMPYHDANNGTENHLLANQGDWRFVNVTEEVGLNQNNRRFSYAAAWEDYDNDGDPDLYVANDFGRNNLYRNDGGRFIDVAAQAGVEDISAGMSVSWGDYNQDGHMDLYVGNMFSSAGNRIAYQRAFRQDHLAAYRRHARGNTLFENAGDGTFRDVTLQAGVNLGRWAWASPFVDLNNDGRVDLVVANGMVTGTDDTGDL